jgi:hypothetical protein
MTKTLGQSITQQLPQEITDQCIEINRRMSELSGEALATIEDIEATARASESKSGAIFIR